jgi:hypothetical protein
MDKSPCFSTVVQTISSTEENIIASGSSDGRFDICIWRKPVRFLTFVLRISTDISMTVQASSGQTWRCMAVRSRGDGVCVTRGVVLLGLGEGVSDVDQCTLISQFLNDSQIISRRGFNRYRR